MMISRPTLAKLEQGDPSVAMGTYAIALFVLGLVESLAAVADVAGDPVGQELQNAELPERIYDRSKKQKTGVR
jgi:hypothetical protein